MASASGTNFKPIYYRKFDGGVNYYAGVRSVQDNESPQATNCDFKGIGGVGNRQGFTQIGSVVSSRTKIYGMNTYHTSSISQAVRFASNGSNVSIGYSTGSSWTDYTATTFTDAKNVDSISAGGKLVTFNGTDAMQDWDGSSLAAHTGGKVLKYGEYFDKRLWGVDPASLDTLWFSTQYGDATKPLDFTASGTSSDKGSITLQPGAGVEIRGLKSFKNALYVWLFPYGIYRIKTTSTINVFTVELVTNSVGCVSHRGIAQVGEDLFFPGDDGVYSLGDVGTYLDVRTQNKSLRIQQIFDGLSGATKQLLVGEYYNFKYHLFYSLYGTNNDSCVPFDIRYQAWQDWRGMAANDATRYVDSAGLSHFYFGDPLTGKVYEMYSGATDAGTAIPSTYYTKSFDLELPDVMKLYFDTTPVFGQLGGSASFAVVFNDSEVATTATLTQANPQGGFGRNGFGGAAFGDATNTLTVTQVINQPQRLKAKGQKFSVQYRITSSGQWRLDTIGQWLSLFDHYKFPSTNKLN